MSATAVDMPASGGPLMAARLNWRLVAFLAVGFLPFVPSILAMESFLLADNALGFVPFVLPLSGWLFWRYAHQREEPKKRDVIVDVFFAAPFAAGAVFVLLIMPARLSWYFWLYRVDLLALPLFVLAAGFVFFGYLQVLRMWPAFGMLFLAWPYGIVRVQQELGWAFINATTWLAGQVVSFLHLPYERDAQTFVTTHLPDGENLILVISQLCSGTATFVGFGLIGLALMFMMRGRVGRRLRWLALGLALAFLANLVRLVVLLTLTVWAGARVAIDVVHPLLGLGLFVVLLISMLGLLRAFGLGLELLPRGKHRAWEPVGGGGRPLKALYAVAAGFAVLMAVLDAEAQDYSFLGVGDGAPTIDVTSERAILPDIDGWELTHVSQLYWTDLFGRRSRGDIFEYAHPSGQFVTVQNIITDDKSTLDRYSLEECIIFHRRKIEGRETVTLGHGVIGVILHDTYEGVPSSALYWQIPVNVDGEVRHVRVALFADIESPRREVKSVPATVSFARRIGITLENVFDGEPPPDVARAQLDLELIELASQIVDTMVRTGGPARTVDEAAEGASG